MDEAECTSLRSLDRAEINTLHFRMRSFRQCYLSNKCHLVAALRSSPPPVLSFHIHFSQAQMKTSTSFAASAAALLFSATVEADSIYTKSSPVLQVTAKTYGNLIAKSNHTSVRPTLLLSTLSLTPSVDC